MDQRYCIIGKKISADKVMFVIDDENTPMVFVDAEAACEFLLKNGYNALEVTGFKFYKSEYLITGVLKEVEEQRPS
jgi:hypothetical protein